MEIGTKYSSLNYILQFPIDGIKIDKSFVDRIQCFEKESKFIKNIIKFAHEINLDIVAEGVESESQFENLNNSNCNKI